MTTQGRARADVEEAFMTTLRVVCDRTLPRDHPLHLCASDVALSSEVLLVLSRGPRCEGGGVPATERRGSPGGL